MKYDTDEIIRIKVGRDMSRDYKGFKGTFAALAYNCLHKKALPGFCYEEGLVMHAERDGGTLSLTISGGRPDDSLIEIMDIALSNLSAFPADPGEAQFSVYVE
ncbi:MAG: hypothetical protein KBG01_05990 [Syntrophobacterales bacterium]|jgi:hypothetical protein|nr:hypothetical protein [Syntrophobacterales bacterium]